MRCDECGQLLHSPIDLDALRSELVERAKTMRWAMLAIVAMLALNFLLFRGVGAIVAVAPIAWFGNNFLRWRVVRARLRRHEPADREGYR